MWIKFGLVGTLAAIGVDLPIWAILGLVGGTGLIGFGTLLVDNELNLRRPKVVALRTLLGQLRLEPTDRSCQASLLRLLDASPTFTAAELISVGLTTGAIYRQALEAAGAYPQFVESRDFALQVGRWHYAQGREDRRPRLDDEQAIQNDLFVRLWGRAA